MSKERAKQHFYALYLEKTGNEWPPGDSGSFQKHPGKFYPLEIDYGQEEEEVAKLSAGDPSSSSSSLAPEVQSLVRLIFDVESMKKTMMEFEVGGQIHSTAVGSWSSNIPLVVGAWSSNIPLVVGAWSSNIPIVVGAWSSNIPVKIEGWSD